MARDTTRKATLSSRISAELREQILRGDLAPGEKINLDRLRDAYGISISPLREAVSRLVADGLVSFEDQRGYTVTPISAADLAEVTQLRGELEVMALAASIAEGDLDWESRIMGAQYRLSRTPKADTDWETAHTEFHLALISGCNKARLLQFCTVLRTQHDRYRRVLLSGGDNRRVDEEHAAIAEAAVQRESARAQALLRAHIEATGAELRALLQARAV